MSWVRVPARATPLQRLVWCAALWTRQAIAQVQSSPSPWRVAAGGVLACGVSERSAPLVRRASHLAARSVPSTTPRDAAPWSVHMAWGLTESTPQAEVPGASEPNIALEPTPTASARASLRLPAAPEAWAFGPLTITPNGSKGQVENTVRTQDQHFSRFTSTAPAGCVRAEELCQIPVTYPMTLNRSSAH